MRPILSGLTLALLLSHMPVLAQESGLAFLRIGVNAEAAAMGDAQVALSRGAFSTYWNPAGLSAAGSNSLGASYHSWVGDSKTYAAAARFRSGEKGGFGLFVTAMGNSGLEARTSPGEPQGTFDVQFVSTGASYGRKFGPVRAGITAKYLNERIFTSTASGYAFDFGLQAELLKGDLRLGLAYQNAGEMSVLEADATRLPRMLRAGVGVFPLRISSASDDAALLETVATGEIVYNFTEEETQIHVGIDAEVLEVIHLRAGYISNDQLRQLTFGTGFGYEGLRFDYAFLPFEEGFGGAGHILTLIYLW